MKLVGYIVVGVLAALGLAVILINVFIVDIPGPPECRIVSSTYNTSTDGASTATIEAVQCGIELKARLVVTNGYTGVTDSVDLPLYMIDSAVPHWTSRGELIIGYRDPAKTDERPGSVAGIELLYDPR